MVYWICDYFNGIVAVFVIFSLRCLKSNGFCFFYYRRCQNRQSSSVDHMFTYNDMLCIATRSICRLCNCCKQTTIILCSATDSLMLLLLMMVAIITITIICCAQTYILNGTGLTISSWIHHHQYFYHIKCSTTTSKIGVIIIIIWRHVIRHPTDLSHPVVVCCTLMHLPE